jgi:WD40 repeat protein
MSRLAPAFISEASNMLPRFALGLFAAFILVSTVFAQAPANPRADSLGDPLPPGAIARLGTLRFKHNLNPRLDDRFGPGGLFSTSIAIAVYTPDGKTIASLAQPFGSIRLWDAASGKQLPGPWSSESNYEAIAIAPDGATLAAAGFSRQRGAIDITLWDIATAKELKVLRAFLGQNQNVQAIVFADGGKTLISVGDGSVRWWDVAAGKVAQTWKAPLPSRPKSSNPKIQTETSYDYLFSPDAKSLAVQMRSYQFEPGRAIMGNNIVDEFNLSEAIGLDLATGKLRWRVTAKGSDYEEMRCAFSGDGKRVAISSGRNKVELRDAVTGKLIDSPSLDSKAHRTDYIGALALSPEGGIVAIAGQDGHIVMWRPAGHSPVPSTTEAKEQERTGTLRQLVCRGTITRGSSSSLAFSPDGKTLLVGAGADLQSYDVATLKEVTPWAGHRDWVDHVAFSLDGRQLLTGTLSFHPLEVATWDVASWKQLQLSSNRVPQWPNIGISSLEHTYYVGKEAADRFSLYDQRSGKMLGRFSVPLKQNVGTASFFSPGSKFYILAGKDEQNKDAVRLFGVPSCKLLCQLPALPFFNGQESSRPLSFSADDRLVAMFGRDDGAIQIFETATGKLSKRLGNPPEVSPQVQKRRVNFSSLAFSPDGKLLASWNAAEPVVRVWDLTTGKERLRLPPDEERHFRMHLAWSPDGRVLAVGDHKIQLWELAAGKIRQEFVGHEGDVRCLAFSPNGRLLASGSMDTTVLIWDVWGR